MDSLEATFPALIVYDDNSVAAFTALEDWTHDVDQWYWSDAGDYIIDSLGRKFVQEAHRDADKRPVEIPIWRFDSDADEDLIDSLVSGALGSQDWIDRDQLGDSRQRIRYMIDRIVEFDAAVTQRGGCFTMLVIFAVMGVAALTQNGANKAVISTPATQCEVDAEPMSGHTFCSQTSHPSRG